jgi:hypothetical protein
MSDQEPSTCSPIVVEMRERTEAVVREHDYANSRPYCYCGALMLNWDQYAAHIARVLYP